MVNEELFISKYSRAPLAIRLGNGSVLGLTNEQTRFVVDWVLTKLKQNIPLLDINPLDCFVEAVWITDSQYRFWCEARRIQWYAGLLSNTDMREFAAFSVATDAVSILITILRKDLS